MPRTADYTIQGFLYQFNKALLELLKSADDAEVTIEGIIEDIEIAAPAGTTAIQCKYHETKGTFTISVIFKPLLQMMQHFHANPQATISYVLFAHFPIPPENQAVTKADLEAALATENKDLVKIAKELAGKIDLNKFLGRFSIHYGPSWDGMVTSVHEALLAAGIAKGDIETLAYPNAIQTIANLSIVHDPALRRITKKALLRDLAKIRSTAISRWTLLLRTKKQLLEAKRKQLKLHLDRNARLRYFIVNCAAIEDFDDHIVGFVCDFLGKYHFKAAHICTPIFCLDTTDAVFRDIQIRLHKKGIISNDGFVGLQFDEAHFFRDPMVRNRRGDRELRREFDLRLLRWTDNGKYMSHKKGDDLFIIGKNEYAELDNKDVCVEILESPSLKEIAFVTGVSQSHE